MILVTGARGTVGRRVAARLAAAGEPARLMTREPDVPVGAPPGTEVVRGDFADPVSLLAALAGVRAALLVTSDPLRPDDDVRFVEAARRASLHRLVKLSAFAVQDDLAADLVTDWQRACEEVVVGSGLGWTLLRPRAFMTNTLAWAAAVRSGAPVRAVHPHARNACVDPDDIAEIAVQALCGSAHEGRTYALTGPVALSAADQAGLLARELGRPVEVSALTEQEARRGLLLRHPRPVADALMESAAALAAGRKEEVTATVPRLLGRPARSYAVWASAHAAAFSADR